MQSFLEHLREHPGIGPMICHSRRVEGSPARFATPQHALPRELQASLEARGISALYCHQARALDAARNGQNVLAATPTASGKTLIFALPVLESILEDPGAKALFLYPTKALAQDQVGSLRDLAAATRRLRPPSFEIYDGDTPDHRRRQIRREPPDVLVTNPDMLHLGILAHHREWEPFLRRLRWVVLDELHVYRGIFGAHVHHIVHRLKRICSGLGARPRFVAASATIGNAVQFSQLLLGAPFEVVEESGAPAAAREVVFLNPVTVSPYTLAVRVVAEAARAGLRSICFTKARRVTELLHTWLLKEAPDLRRKIAPYRAGYLPEERRAIEARLFRGELLSVVSTSALELGIDVGGLDVCVLVGYPGSLTSTWQRIGRVGRQDRDALVVMVALPDALDQYVVSHPDTFFGKAFERAVLNPWNPIVAGHHLVCAAAEEPVLLTEIESQGQHASKVVASLEKEGRLARDADGSRWYSFRRNPHRDVNPRSIGSSYTILETRTGKLLGTVDGSRVFHECHPGAIYLHAGQSYRVLRLDTDTRKVEVETARVDYYTVVLGEKETEILDRLEESVVGSFPAGLGRLRVTLRIREYQKKRLFGGESISVHPLSLPPWVFETVGFWIELPASLVGAFTSRGLHFMGGIHAVEHAMIGLYPLLALADRGDVGGISYTGHPQTGGPAIFVYDGIPGGAGLAEEGFRDLRGLLERARELISACPCDAGCPSCVQSPRCGNGNKPLDKMAALLVLATALGGADLAAAPATPAGESTRAGSARGPNTPPPRRRHGVTRGGNLDSTHLAVPDGPRVMTTDSPARHSRESTPRDECGGVLVFDLETQRSAEEVGGWGHASKMGLALAVVYDFDGGAYRTYRESDVDRLLLDLALAGRVVGFNIDRFDLEVLSGYTDRDLGKIRTLDLLTEVHRRLGFRLSLGHLSEVNLNEPKTGNGMTSLLWWRQGRIDLIEEYCRKDVEMTRRLFVLGHERGYLLYRDRVGRVVRVPVNW